MKNFDLVQSWIDNVAYSHSKSENTEQKYRRYFRLFCEFIEKTPQQILEEYDRMTDREFRKKYSRYVRALISHLSHQDYTIATVKAVVDCVRSFFKYNDLPLGHIPLARYRVTFHNRDIKKDEIVDILKISHPRDRAFFCVMAQTGLRPDTICNLRLRHIQPDFSNEKIPCKVEVPQEIAKGEYHSYFTFMGEESIRHLKAYLATRANMGSEDYLFTLHGKEKKLDRKSMSHIFRRAVLKLKRKGLMDLKQKQKGKPSDIRLYNLRKYFRKMANQAGFEFVQFWMGHIVKEGVDEHYRPKDVEFHRQLYAEKAMPFLRFETATPTETEKTIEDLKKQLLKEREENIKELDELRAKYEQLEKIFREGYQAKRKADSQTIGEVFAKLLSKIESPEELKLVSQQAKEIREEYERIRDLSFQIGFASKDEKQFAKNVLEQYRVLSEQAKKIKRKKATEKT